jgi:hypothetical protein
MIAFCYRFWMKALEKREWGAGAQYLHRAGASYRAQVARKLETHERLVNIAAFGLGLLQVAA